MTSVMTYKGYSARVDYDDEDGIFVGRLAGINDVIGFHAETVPDLRAAFHEAVDDYVESCAAIGKEPERSYSGKMMFRVRPEVHQKAALAAELMGKSLNQWAEEVMEQAAEGAEIVAAVPDRQANAVQILSVNAKRHLGGKEVVSQVRRFSRKVHMKKGGVFAVESSATSNSEVEILTTMLRSGAGVYKVTVEESPEGFKETSPAEGKTAS